MYAGHRQSSVADFPNLLFYLLVPKLTLLYIESVVLESHGAKFKIAMKNGPQHSRSSLFLKIRLHNLPFIHPLKKNPQSMQPSNENKRHVAFVFN